MKKLGIVTALAMFVMMLAFALGGSPVFATSHTEDYETELTTGFTTTPPVIDGNFTAEEWADANLTYWWYEPTSLHPDNYIYVYFMNDNTNLYLLFDVTPDNTSETGLFGDYIAVGFDENNDNEFIFTAYPVLASHETYIAAYKGSSDYTSDYTVRYELFWGFAKSPNENGYKHTIVEMSIPLSNFQFGGQVAVGDTMGFHAEGYGTLAPKWDYPKTSVELWELDETDPAWQTENWSEITLGQYVQPATTVIPPVTTPANHAHDIGIWLMVIGGIVVLAAVFFREDLGRAYAPLVFVGILVMAGGLLNYVYEYVKVIPYIAQIIFG